MDEHTHEPGHEGHDHDEMGECIEECLNCHIACTLAAQQVISGEAGAPDPDLISALLDCAEICQVSANFMLRGSASHVITCAACAVICRETAEACRAVQGNEDLEHCAEICERCADSCERMAEAEGEEE
jgi:hypothetical protein